jgi:ABC-type nitrate/sulfonate/bicarbonate transport system ATPase subunit
MPRALPLHIDAVSHGFAFGGHRLPVLQEIDLDIAAGEFVSLLGPSGCGKSTLLRLVSGLDLPESGRIVAGEAPVAGPDRSRILVFQDPTLFPWLTVAANVGAGLEAAGLLPGQRGKIDAALSLVQLGQFAKAYPHQLSGGMAQRVALARALVNEPSVLLLDEPLGKLDSLTRLSLQDELLALWQAAGFTALLVTHDVEEALLLSDRVVVLSPRPARILSEIRVDLPRPRHREDPAFVALRHGILATLGHGEPTGIKASREPVLA